MPFGLDGSKGWSSRRGRTAGAWAAFAIECELLSLPGLAAEAGPAGILATTPPGAARAERLITYASLLREIARRGAQVEMLARAASAANRARHEAKSDHALAALALLEQAEAQRLGFTLFGDIEAAATAHACADEAIALNPPALTTARLNAVKAGLDGALALAANDAPRVLKSLDALEVAMKVQTALHIPVESQAALITDRAELMIGLGWQTQDRAFPASAAATLKALAGRLDPDRTPLSWARTEAMRGQALAAFGDLAGDTDALAEAVTCLKAAAIVLPPRHSPLDEARVGHALGLALQAFGEASEDQPSFDRSVRAFSAALEMLDSLPALPYRAIVAHDGALCLTRRAERRGDLAALEEAERTFRNALKSQEATTDPLAWAVTQVALARIYEAQAGLRLDTGERADAAFALTSALDVFAEHGLRTLSAAVLAALDRVKTPA